MKRTFVKNRNSEYYIIDHCATKMLLQRKSDGEIVVAHNYDFRVGPGLEVTVSWQHGSYFGSNIVAAAQEFYGKGRFGGGQEIGKTREKNMPSL